MFHLFVSSQGDPLGGKKIMASQARSSQDPEDSTGNSTDDPTLEVVHNDKDFVARFAMLYNSEMFSDIILRVGEEHFFTHKFMLITCSEVFEAMLSEERWRESHQPEISLTEEDECAPVFSDFLRYIYSGVVNLTTDNVLPILLLADKYSIPILRQSCVEYMTRHIVESPDTNRTLSWYQYAKMTGNNLLVDQCSKFILSNFDIILKASDWVEVTKQEIMEFLSSCDVVVQSEYELWMQLEKWLTSEHNFPNIVQNLRDIIPLLRFTMISPKDLLKIEESTLCKNHGAMFSEKLHLAYRHHSLLFDQVEMKSGIEQFRNYTSDVYGLCNDVSLLNYPSVGKIDSKLSRRFSIPLQFVSQVKPCKQKHVTHFEVSFWPKGHYTTFTLYGNHIGRQTESTTLSIKRIDGSKSLPAMETTITLIIYGVKNGVRYVAFTYTKSHMFTQQSYSLFEDNVIALKSLCADNSPFLINGNLDAKVFIKVQNIISNEND